jgi:hypothetical protein
MENRHGAHPQFSRRFRRHCIGNHLDTSGFGNTAVVTCSARGAVPYRGATSTVSGTSLAWPPSSWMVWRSSRIQASPAWIPPPLRRLVVSACGIRCRRGDRRRHRQFQPSARAGWDQSFTLRLVRKPIPDLPRLRQYICAICRRESAVPLALLLIPRYPQPGRMRVAAFIRIHGAAATGRANPN